MLFQVVATAINLPGESNQHPVLSIDDTPLPPPPAEIINLF